MDGAGAYGGGKAGGAFNPIAFAQRPPVLLRAVCWVSNVFIFSHPKRRGLGQFRLLKI